MPTRYDILPKGQKALLPHLRALIPMGFVLYGGTAIALQLGHRESIDFDFFSDLPLSKPDLVAANPLLAGATVLQDERETWTVLVQPPRSPERPVKLSFFGALHFGRVGTPEPSDGGELLLASLDDLFGHKLKVLLQRVELKDYRDIAAMLRSGLPLERGLAAAGALFGNMFPPAEALRALGWFRDGDLRLLPEAGRATLLHAIQNAGPVRNLKILSRRLGIAGR